MKTKTQTNEEEIGLSDAQIERLKDLTTGKIEQRKQEHLKKLESMNKKELVQTVLSLERAIQQKNGFLVDLRNLVEAMEPDVCFDTEFNQVLLKEFELSEQEEQFMVFSIDDITSNYHEEE